MKKNLLFIPILISNLVIAQEEKQAFDEYEDVERVFNKYLVEVDKKNIRRMHHYFNDKCTLVFGSGKPVVLNTKEEFINLFNIWKRSPKAEFTRTRLDKIEILPVWDTPKTRLCTVDATYSRLNGNGEVIGTGRTLYHLMRHKYFLGIDRIIRKYKKWRIYMMTDLDIDS